MDSISEFRLHRAQFADLDPFTLYALLRLRVDVFVVEQECPYPELDGLDTDKQTTHLWLTRPDSEEPLGYLRILVDPDGTPRIGRVVVARQARGARLAGRLLTEALELVGDRPCVLSAQSHLVGFYGRYGFQVDGPQYLEDGIPHTPMRRG